MKRVLPKTEGEGKEVPIFLRFADGTRLPLPIDVSEVKEVGDTLTYVTQQIMLAPTGDASICVGGEYSGHFRTLYAFVVSADALLYTSLLFLLLNVALAASITIALQ